MSNDELELPRLPSGPDALLDELHVRSRHDVRWAGLWKVVQLPDWKRRIQVQALRSIQSCIPTGIVLTNVYLPQGVAVTLNSVGQVKEFGSKEWYFVYLCECDTASTVQPTTAPDTTSGAPATPPAHITEMIVTFGLTSTAIPGSTEPPTTVTPWCDMYCNTEECPDALELDCCYQVEIDGLGGILEPFNGTWDLPYTGSLPDHPCRWHLMVDVDGYPNAAIHLQFGYLAANRWSIIAALTAYCFKGWISPIALPPEYCDPLGTYAEDQCVHSGCAWGDPDPCPDSAGATCVVSEC